MTQRIQQLFTAQSNNQFALGQSNCKERIKKLERLLTSLQGPVGQELRNALHADLHKPQLESDLTEIYQVIKEIKLARRELNEWMAVRRVSTPLVLFGTRSWYQFEPKGKCLIIAPWNFPVGLTLGPLVSAISAGNTAIIKPSEMAPHTAAVLSRMISALYPENEVAVVEGGQEVSQELLKLPFNHIFFTGSPRVGKIVMKAAADHLASVTLELGGKSPAIVDRSAALKSTARKIAWGKFLNAGQICISPDYVLVHESVMEEFIAHLKNQLTALFSESPTDSADYGRIVNSNHLERLRALLENSLDKGATLVCGGQYDIDKLYMAPTLLANVPVDSAIMKEEIFGPILPIISYKTTEDAIQFINAGEKPLALYFFGKRGSKVRQVLKQSSAGSSCVNTNLLQFSNPNLPFGGVNYSGFGKSHGFYGFREFSNQRAVLKQYLPTPTELLFPPYNDFKQWLSRFALRWL